MSAASTTHPNTVQRLIVIRQHDQLGDMLCAVPLLRALHAAYPKAEITLIASPVNFDIMLHHPYVHHVINYDKRQFFSSLTELWKFYRKLRTIKYDIAVVPVTVSISRTSNLLAFLTGAKIRFGPNRLGELSNPTKWCFTTKVDLDWSETPRRHQTLRNLDILLPLDIRSEDLSTVIGLTDKEKVFGKEFVSKLKSQHKFIVGVHPGAGKVNNRWPAGRFAAIINRLSKEYSAGIVITAGPMDEEPVRELIAGLTCPFTLVENQPIRNVAAIIDQLDLILTNDTGIMHIAGAARPRVLALFGPTDPLQWAPIGTKNRFIAAEDTNIDSITEENVYSMLDVILHEIQQDLKLR